MDNAFRSYRLLAEYNLEAASYVVPNGFNRRALLNIHLRSAMHLLSSHAFPWMLDSSIRRVAQKMAAEMLLVFPLLEDILRVKQGRILAVP